MQKPDVPVAQIVYGRIVYSLCTAVAVVCAVASTLSVACPNNNVANPAMVFFSIWAGNTPETVWSQASGGFPGGHFWVRSLPAFDAITQLAIVVGCTSALTALLGVSAVFLQDRPRSLGWALMSLGVVLLIVVAALDLW